MKTRTLLVATALTLTSVSAFSNTAPSENQYDLILHNTGINIDEHGVDQSYTYSTTTEDSRLPATGQAVLPTEGLYPMTGNNWLANNDVSKWITPDATINTNSGSGGFQAGSLWEYQTTFTLDAGTILDSVVINGRWMVDNEGISISLNGIDLGFGVANGENVFVDWSEFNIGTAYGNNYFQDGLNTLTFTIKNAASAGPSGLRIEMTGVAAVPEPSTYAMLGLGLLMIGALARRRQAQS